MENVVACVLMAAVSLPLSYFAARGCLRGVVRIVTGSNKRSVL
jgi:hypothetical protein